MRDNIISHWKLAAILALYIVFSSWGECSGKGNAESPRVAIKAYLNIQSGCQGEVIDLLEGFKKKYPGKVKIEYIDFGTKKGLEQTLKANLHCMTILVNGKQTFKLRNKAGEIKTVIFSHPMGLQWKAEDLGMAVKQEIERMYK